MDPISAGLGIVTGVISLYGLVTTSYDLCLDVKEIPSTYHELRMGLIIERKKLELWAASVLSDHEQERVKLSPKDWGLWKIFELIFAKMLEAFEESHQTMESLGHHAGLPKQQDSSSDWELLESMSYAVKGPPRRTLKGLFRTSKFVLRDKRRIEYLIKKLGGYNDSLNQMSSRLEQEKHRRRLRALLSTGDIAELEYLETAARMFHHPDIQRMASARSVIEQANRPEPAKKLHDSSERPMSPISEFRLEMNQLKWQDTPYGTDRPRAMATYLGSSVIVDWQSCSDDTWRRQYPLEFHARTDKLAQILNSNLRPLSLSVLHCVGYLDKNSNVTGYAFRLPENAAPGSSPVTLEHLLKNVRKPEDIPDLGERFDLAKALVNTIFEIHNLGWMHKNISPKNILFWPKSGTKDEWNVSEPYLMGFDIARPNQPGEVTEKPTPQPEDDIYRHPFYKGEKPRTFQPSYDMYSLGILLYEIGRWRRVIVPQTTQHRNANSDRPPLVSIYSDPDFVEKLLEDGSVKDLKRTAGTRYRDAVVTCLRKDFDGVWEQPCHTQEERQKQLQNFLDQVQRRVVDTIAVCNA
ncbi:hypothetical protein MMC21_004340 [Puttea exsequens]|nr:hypothetical protein [Puttea exsequens]